MIEQVMFFSLGFFVAALLAIAIAPAFWHRAIRLSTRRLELRLPQSTREIAAARDLVRAQSALECRRLEQIAQGHERARANDKIELGRRALEIARLDADLASARQRNTAQENEIAALRRDLAQSTAELGTTASALHDASGRCEQQETKLFDLRCHLTALHVLSRNQRIAFSALERDLLRETEQAGMEAVRVAALSDELAASRRAHAADLEKLETALAEAARRNEALAAARTNSVENERRYEERAAEATATKRRLDENIERLCAENADLREALDAAETRARGIEDRSVETDENAVLRLQIAKIGAAVSRLANAAEISASHDTAKISTEERAT